MDDRSRSRRDCGRETNLTARSDADEEIPLEAPLLPREREILLAGGMLKHLREGGQERIGIVEGDSASAESGGIESGHQPMEEK